MALDAYRFNWDNTDEQKVVKARLFSAYKGKFVLKLPIGQNAFSFGIMVIGSDVTNSNTIKHEYGHAVHFEKIGPFLYTFLSGIPSLWDFLAGTDPYYAEPQEHVADYYGEVYDRTYDGGEYPYSRKSETAAHILFAELVEYIRDRFGSWIGPF